MQEELKKQEEKFEAALDEVKKNFARYQEEFYKLEGIADALEGEAKRLKEENDLYRKLYKRLQELFAEDNVDRARSLISGLDIKL